MTPLLSNARSSRKPRIRYCGAGSLLKRSIDQVRICESDCDTGLISLSTVGDLLLAVGKWIVINASIRMANTKAPMLGARERMRAIRWMVSAASPSLRTQLIYFVDEANEMINARALQVVDRVTQKLTGTTTIQEMPGCTNPPRLQGETFDQTSFIQSRNRSTCSLSRRLLWNIWLPHLLGGVSLDF